MKFTIAAVVVLALATSSFPAVQSSVIPLGLGAPWGVSPWAVSPWAVSPWSAYAHGPAAVAVAPHLPYAVHAVHAPAIVPVAHEGTYTAATRGAVHVAPLPGHLQSASSINLQPAPGTW